MAEVIIQDEQFEPDELVIPAGTEVIWRNEDDVDHTVTADDGSFESGDLAPGSVYAYTFDVPTDCSYHCDYHPTMTGHITVQ